MRKICVEVGQTHVAREESQLERRIVVARSLHHPPAVSGMTTLQGLTREQAKERLREYGPNALPAPKRAGFVRRVVRQFQSALIYLLLLALALDLLAWWRDGASGVPVEALAIFAVLVLNAGLGVLQEYRSESALAELKRLGSPRSWVHRDGALEHVLTSDIVPGDWVRLEAGVPGHAAARPAGSRCGCTRSCRCTSSGR